ncbi:MAG: dTMP kinase [Candidatus Berkelbacteria bacterium]|nr:dTMP kinase [Candidatus Berkelbacteria bacterium]
MPRKGKFIVIEGSDGIGKKTQADLIIKMFRRIGRQVVFYDFPQYERSFFGKMVADYLNEKYGDVNESDPYLISLLYAGDRFESAEHIRHDINKGKIVICNRYTQSNMGFQTAKIKSEKGKKDFLEWLEELEFGIFNIPKPDMVIYLYAPHTISQNQIDKKGQRNYTDKKRDIHERNGDFLAQVEKEYLNLAKNNPEWRTIICASNDKMLSPEEISAKVFAVIEGKQTAEKVLTNSLF